MKGLSFSLYLCFSLFLLSLLGDSEADQASNNGVYIIYMGAANSTNGTLREDHSKLLSSLSRRKRSAMTHTYKHGFSGIAARLTKEEADLIAQRPGVVSVFPDPVFKLHTTRSWDFLKYQTDLKIDFGPGYDSDSLSSRSDTIIGILDSGIWPESPSFTDKSFGPIPSRWKGTCMKGQNFTSSNCNRKLIGARYYNNNGTINISSPRDRAGHGTHVASTAAGNPVSGASYYGLAAGTAKGGSPSSRIAIYRVCTYSACYGSAILAAFDDAIADGVDVLSISIGTSSDISLELSNDPIAIGAFHAVERGILVVCSAGNEGPGSDTVVNVSPWILTVAATTIDRDFESHLVLGNNKVIKGGGIHVGDLQKTPVYPLIYGLNAKPSTGYYDDSESRNCNPDALAEDKVKGKIVVCQIDDDYYSDEEKALGVQTLGGIGIVLIDGDERLEPSNYESFPASAITSNDASELLSYVNSTGNPVATILPTVAITKYKPAPMVAYFSSRGPSLRLTQLLKPDIAAPGVNILAAWLGNDTSAAPMGRDPPLFYFLSGTSMACPHVSGIAATIKSQFPTWSPSAIKSAIMTTATQTNNLKGPITSHSVTVSVASPYDYGAGEVTITGPFQPGLVYETNTIDYLQFLCNYGYDTSTVKAIASVIPDGFTCPSSSSVDLISNMNYPSIAISKFAGKESRKVIRTVTNVGDHDETLYTAVVDAPAELNVKVTPEKLQFTKKNKKLSYHVVFTSTKSLDYYWSGSITWTDGKYKVRTPFVVINR